MNLDCRGGASGTRGMRGVRVLKQTCTKTDRCLVQTSSDKSSMDTSTKDNGGKKRYHLRPVSRESRSKLAELVASEEEEDFCSECFRDTTRIRRYPHLRSNRDCATVRERNRMHNINRAFEELRKVIPKTSNNGEAKLSKIATLRLAIHYISVLGNVLERGENEEEGERTEPMSKRQRLREEEQDTSSNTSSNELDSECSPEGVFFNESFWCGTLEEFVSPYCDDEPLENVLKAYSMHETSTW